MDLVPILGIPSMYPGDPIHLIDDHPPSYLALIVRFVTLSIKFSPVTSTAWLALLSSKFRDNVWYKWLTSCLAAGGPAWIKWGQWAATREDMWPATLCEQLQHLHNDAPAHSWRFTQKIMESSLGLPRGSLLQVFESFDPVPVASGSIAQVHKAVLKGERRDEGVLVAVKVRHPRVAQLIDMDFRIMSGMARVVDMIPALSWLNVRESVDQFSHTMAAQAHLNVESHHLEVLNNNFRNWPTVRFPRPFYSSSSIIIETYERGSAVSKIIDTYDAMAADVSNEMGDVSVEEANDDGSNTEAEGKGYELIPIQLAKFIVTTGLSIYLKMLLTDNLMHADLHPGNIMLDLMHGKTPPNTSGETSSSSTALVPVGIDYKVKGNPFVCLVDAGMVAQLTDEESENFIGLMCSLGDGDGKFAAQCALRFSKDTDLSEEEQQAFIDDVCLVFAECCRGYGTDVDVGNVLQEILGLIRKHRVRIGANYATLVVNALCIESLARRVCPSYNVLDAAKPMLQTYRRIAYTKDGTPRKVRRRLQILMWCVYEK
jgi:aarF domain-containing kinase